MKIAQGSFVSVSYTLTVDGQVADKAEATNPLEFIFGMGMLLPKFEENIAGQEVGYSTKFTLEPKDGYGDLIAEAIVELPKDIFTVEGKFDDEVIKVGAVLPMMDNEGNQMPGRVMEVKESVIVMDFNSPMAGKTLNFEVKVEGVRESTPEDLAKFMPTGGGCSCSSEGCGEDSDCESSCCGDCKC